MRSPSRFKRFNFLLARAFGLILAVGAAACQSPSLDSSQREPMAFHPPDGSRAPASLGCETMIESFCDALYSPQANGNLQMGTGTRRLDVFQGRTENDFKAPIYFYNNIKLKRREFLPADFRHALERQGYFISLKEFLSRPARTKMTVTQRLEDIRHNHRLQSIWDSSKDEALLVRMRKLNPFFHNLADDLIPLEDGWQLDRVRRQLINEIATSLWTGHPNWKRVESSFEEIRDQMLGVVQEIDVPDETRARWTGRISAVKLVLPGSLPEIADEDCAATEVNAYYYPRQNVITVCAGDFNSEDIYQTLAHELSHAVDAGSQAYQFMIQSRLAVSLAPLREQSCRKKPVNCEQWGRFKNMVTDHLNDWHGYKADVPEFQQCLQRQKPSKTIDDEALESTAKREVGRAIAALADSHVFLRITKEKLPYPDGTWRKNPAYLNACRTDELAMPRLLETEELLRMFFVNEYQCSGESPDKLKKAILSSRDLAIQIAKGVMGVEGPLSGNDNLVQGGYAVPPDERFADVLGSYTFSRILSTTPGLASRRALYLASSSWQCSPPSLAKQFPEEARIERQFSFATHAFGKDRRRENLSMPMRSVLQCNKDFEFDECQLPFRPAASIGLHGVTKGPSEKVLTSVTREPSGESAPPTGLSAVRTPASSPESPAGRE